MRYEETSWRSLQDVVGVVLATTKNERREQHTPRLSDAEIETVGNEAGSRKKH